MDSKEKKYFKKNTFKRFPELLLCLARGMLLCAIISLCGPRFVCAESQRETISDFQPVSNSFKKETISYEIKNFGIKSGEATFVFEGVTEINKKKALLIIFTAEALNFFDQEKIFLDPKSFYPMAVYRNLNLWGQKEVIVEEYFQEKGLVKISKRKGGKVTEQTIKRAGPIDNIYAFIFRYRSHGLFKKGETLDINLPTREVQITLEEETKFKLDDKEYEAYYLRSIPPKYKIWFEDSPKKIPLRIDGTIGFGKTSMVMKGYQSEIEM